MVGETDMIQGHTSPCDPFWLHGARWTYVHVGDLSLFGLAEAWGLSPCQSYWEDGLDQVFFETVLAGLLLSGVCSRKKWGGGEKRNWETKTFVAHNAEGNNAGWFWPLFVFAVPLWQILRQCDSQEPRSLDICMISKRFSRIRLYVEASHLSTRWLARPIWSSDIRHHVIHFDCMVQGECMYM